MFLLIYTFEQLLLVILSFLLKEPSQLNFVIALFSLIVLMTFSIHKLLMESRIKMLESKINDLMNSKISLEDINNRIYVNHHELIEKIPTENL